MQHERKTINERCPMSSGLALDRRQAGEDRTRPEAEDG
jgi:hypothetical protein